ncbi:hypothetical protein F4859DRAFT_69147 [Xylaria cf. heliscus]|nr:hypothetical protein F4859DRAFT_69147 [Xylaria cf. heliscus]
MGWNGMGSNVGRTTSAVAVGRNNPIRRIVALALQRMLLAAVAAAAAAGLDWAGWFGRTTVAVGAPVQHLKVLNLTFKVANHHMPNPSMLLLPPHRCDASEIPTDPSSHRSPTPHFEQYLRAYSLGDLPPPFRDLKHLLACRVTSAHQCVFRRTHTLCVWQ